MQAFLYIGALLAAMFGLVVVSEPQQAAPANTPSQATAIEAAIELPPATFAEPAQERVKEPETKAPSSPQSNTQLSNDNYYTNVDGERVHSPAYTPDNSVPPGASARCRDGTYSFSKNRRGTCSHHGGVAQWL